MNTIMIKRGIAKIVSKGVQNAPQIGFATSIALQLFGAYFTAKGAIKSLGLVKAYKKEVSDTKYAIGLKLGDEPYTKKEAKKDILKAKGKLAKRLFVNYAPAVICEGASIALGVASFGKIAKKLAATTAAFNAFMLKTAKYRGKVRKHVGADAEKAMWEDKEEKQVVIDKNGEVIEEIPEEYSVTFDKSSSEYVNSKTYNDHWISSVQRMYENKLDYEDGKVALLEVIDSFGIYLPQEERNKIFNLGWSRKANPDCHVVIDNWSPFAPDEDFYDADNEAYILTFRDFTDISQYA